jgi:hypothetical protein
MDLSIAGISTEIRSEHLPNTSIERSRKANRARSIWSNGEMLTSKRKPKKLGEKRAHVPSLKR